MIRAFASLSVRTKLLVSLIISVLLVVGFVLFATAQTVQLTQPLAGILVDTLAQERARELTGTFNSYLTLTRDLVEETTADSSLSIAYVTLFGDPKDVPSRAEIESSYRRVLDLNAVLRQVRFVSTKGDVLVSVPVTSKTSDADEAYYKALAGKSPSTEIYVDRLVTSPEASLKMVGTLEVSGSPIGYLVVDIDPTSSADPNHIGIFSSLKPVQYSTKDIAFYLVGSDGNVISPSKAVSVAPDAGVSVKNLVQNAGAAQGLRNYVSPLTGTPVIGEITPIESLKLMLIAETPAFQVNGLEENAQVLTQFVVVALVVFLILIVLWYLLRRTIYEPIRQIQILSGSVVGTRAQVAVEPVQQRDELGDLYNNLNLLISQSEQNIKVLESRVEERTRDIEATRQIAQIISSIRDVNVLLRQVVDLILQRFTNIYHAQVFLVEPSGEYAVLRVSTGEAGEALLARGHRLAVGSQSVIGQVTLTGQSVVALDTSTSQVHKANELLPYTRAELALPLRINEEIIGALDLQSKRSEAFSEADVKLFQSVADQLAIAITNARLFEESQSRLTEIEGLNRHLLGHAWRNYTAGRKRSLSGGSSGVADSDAWSPLQRKAIASGEVEEEAGPDTVTVAIPIRLRGLVLGAVEWDVPRTTYNENSRQLAVELVNRLAITADNTRLFEQSYQAAQRERLVNDIATKLMQQTDVSQILQVAVKEIGQALKVPQTSIRLASNQDNL